MKSNDDLALYSVSKLILVIMFFQIIQYPYLLQDEVLIFIFYLDYFC